MMFEMGFCWQKETKEKAEKESKGGREGKAKGALILVSLNWKRMCCLYCYLHSLVYKYVLTTAEESIREYVTK